MRPGLNAILGPSGCGKSSLLDILAGRKDPRGLSGEVLLGGVPPDANFKYISGYVVQDDIVMGTLTVKENMQFSAALRLPSTVTKQEKNERINKVIKELGLTKVIDSKVGTPFIRGISGGERKRTAIGMEIITDPSILFLDEPTTGLDASTSKAVLLLLKRMSQQGKTIVFSIHQPRFSIFRLFDCLTLLSAGKTLYHGPAMDALKYFKSIGYECDTFNNPADFFLDVISGSPMAAAVFQPSDINLGNIEQGDLLDTTLTEKFASEYLRSTYNKNTITELEKLSSKTNEKTPLIFKQVKFRTSFCHQLKWTTRRSVKNLLLSPQASIAQLGMIVFLSFVTGIVFFRVKNNSTGVQNRVGAFFLMTANQAFGSLSVVELFIKEKKLFMHEYNSGYYRMSVYFLAKLLADFIPMRSLPGIIFTGITYFMIGFRQKIECFFIMMLSLTMVSYTAASLGLAIAVGQSVATLSNLLTSIIFIFMSIFSGVLINLQTIQFWLAWLKYISIHRYGLNALLINEFVGLKFCSNITTKDEEICAREAVAIVCSGEDYLESQGIEVSSPWSLWYNHVALASLSLIFLTIAFLKLYFMKKTS